MARWGKKEKENHGEEEKNVKKTRGEETDNHFLGKPRPSLEKKKKARNAAHNQTKPLGRGRTVNSPGGGGLVSGEGGGGGAGGARKGKRGLREAEKKEPALVGGE